MKINLRYLVLFMSAIISLSAQASEKHSDRKVANALSRRGIDCMVKDLKEQGPSAYQPYVCNGNVIIPTTPTAAKIIDAAYENQEKTPNKMLTLIGTNVTINDQSVYYIFDVSVVKQK